MIVVDGRNRIQNLTTGAGELLADLPTGGVTELGLPSLVGAVATKARASRTSTQVATRKRGTSGRWLRVTAAPMEGNEGYVAVVIEPARATDLVPILLESYGLTEREVKAIFDKTHVCSRGELVARVFSEHLLDGFHAAVVHRVS